MALHETARDPPRLTRRAVLSLGTATAVGIAGCGYLSDADDPDDEPVPRVPDEEDIISGVDAHYLRFETTAEVVEFDDVDDPGFRRPYIRSEEQAEAVTFHGEPLGDEDPTEILRSIDYEKSTALVLSRRVRGCTQRNLNYVEFRSQHPSAGVSVQFCATHRDSHVECSTDDSHMQVTILDLPVTLDGRPSGFGRGGSSSCHLPIEHPANEGGEDA